MIRFHLSDISRILTKNIMKYTKIAFSFALAFVVASMAPSFAFAIDVQDNGTTAGTISAPATQDNGTTAGTASTPATQNNGTTAGTTGPAVQDNGTTAGTISTPATQDNGTTAGTISSGPATSGNGSGGTSVSVGAGGSASTNGSGAALPVLTNVSQCQYLSSYMKIGQINSSAEVTKLQNFLNSSEGMNMPVTGIFDSATLAAVNAFQAKYSTDVLLPWGTKNPTGQVFYTTTKKINELYCKSTFSLTPAQIAYIEAYRTSVQNHTAPLSSEVGLSGTKNATTTGSANLASNSTSTNDSQVAAAGKTSVAINIWNFVKRIFGR